MNGESAAELSREELIALVAALRAHIAELERRLLGALDWLQRKLIVATSRTKRSADFIALLVTLDHLYGPKPGVRTKPVVIVLDNGPKATAAALAARAHWLTVEWLPWSGITSKPSISPTRPLPMWTPWMPPSTPPSPT
jgi:hypothetical protein